MDKKYLRTIYTIVKKELGSYFNSPIAYIFIAVFLVAGNWLFFNYFFLISQVSLRSYFSLLPWIFLFLAPAITMRLWAEEKKSGTDELLLTLPVTDWQVVLSKFLGSLIFLSIALALTLTLPITLIMLGDIDTGAMIGSYLGALFLGGSYISLGLFISSVTKNQIVAFILSLVACFGVFIVGTGFVLNSAPEVFAPILRFIGLGTHFDAIAKGIIDSKDIIYYVTFIFLWLWLNTKTINRRGI